MLFLYLSSSLIHDIRTDTSTSLTFHLPLITLSSCVPLSMVASASDLPSELVDRILDFIDPKIFYEDPAVSMDKKELGLVASSCRYWAQRCQPRIFEEIILRSSVDVYDLLAFLDDARSCVSLHLRCIILQSNLPKAPWLHLAFVLLPQKVFRRPTTLVVKILDRPFPEKADVPAFNLRQCMPKSVPPPSRLSILRLVRVAFNNFEDLVRLVTNIRPLHTFSCRQVTWKSVAGPLVQAQRCHLSSSLAWLTVSHCTDEAHLYQRLLTSPRSFSQRSRSFSASRHSGSIDGSSALCVIEMVKWLEPFTASISEELDGHLFVDGSPPPDHAFRQSSDITVLCDH